MTWPWQNKGSGSLSPCTFAGAFWAGELMAMRTVSKIVNVGSTPTRPVFMAL
jgi:hypothetical protein